MSGELEGEDAGREKTRGCESMREKKCAVCVVLTSCVLAAVNARKQVDEYVSQLMVRGSGMAGSGPFFCSFCGPWRVW